MMANSSVKTPGNQLTTLAYYLFLGLYGAFLLNRFVKKAILVYSDQWQLFPTGEILTGFKVFEGLLHALFLLFATVLLLRHIRKASKVLLYYIVGFTTLFLLSEIRFLATSPAYSLIKSLVSENGYYLFKCIFPFVVIALWGILDRDATYTQKIMTVVEWTLLVNGFLVLLGVIGGFELLKTYPGTARYGYSGGLYHLSFNSIAYGIILMRRLLLNPQRFDGKALLLAVSMLFFGQKAALLYVALVFWVMLLRSKTVKLAGFFLIALGLLMIDHIVRFLIPFIPFWKPVYEDGGAWSVFFSFRNKTVANMFSVFMEEKGWWEFFLGGTLRYPMRVEMYPFDLWVFTGMIGLCFTVYFFTRILSKPYHWIPLIVASLAGGIYEAPMGMLLFFFWVFGDQKLREHKSFV